MLRLPQVAITMVFALFFAMTSALAQANSGGGWTININTASGANSVPAGGSLPYKVVIANFGNGNTPAGKVELLVPATTDYKSITGLENCSVAANTDDPASPYSIVTCDVPVLAPGEEITATLTLQPNVAKVIEVGGSVSNADGSNSPAMAVSSRQTTIVEGADVSLKLDVAKATVQSGSKAEFSATIANAGPYPAKNMTLSIPIPTGLSSNIDLPNGCQISGGNIVCAVAGPIAVGEEIKFNFASQVTVGYESTITIAGQLEVTSPGDPNTTNNNAKVDQKVLPGTDLSLQKTRAPQGLLLVGDDVTFTLNPQFVGTAPKTATIVDIIPAAYSDLDFSLLQGSGWSCTLSGQQLVCNFDSSQGGNYTAPITIKAKAATASAQAVVNEATVVSPDENLDATGNNTASDGGAYIEEPIVDLKANKSGPPRGLVTVGNSYDYKLNSVNQGNKAYVGPLTITDHLPEGLTLTAINIPAGWQCSPSPEIAGPKDIVCTTDKYTAANPLRPGNYTDTITLTTKVTGTGKITNGMTVSGEGVEDGTSSSVVESADDRNWADIKVKKSIIGSNQIISGEAITFKVEVSNEGPATATNVVLDDRVNDIVAGINGGTPAAIVPVINSGIATGISCNGATGGGYYRDLQCVIDSLPKCTAGVDCPSFEFTVNVGSEGSKTNQAIAFSTKTPDNDTSNNSSSVNYSVSKKTDVTVSKTSPASQSGGRSGQELVYVLTASVPNNGLSSAEQVKITDTLPADLYFVSAVASTGSCSVTPNKTSLTAAGNNQLVCELGTINNGAQQTVTVTVIPTTKLVDKTIINNASVTTATTEIDNSNNSTSLPVKILPPELDLIIDKTDDGYDPVEKGADTVYTISVSNTGPSDSYNLQIVDTFPNNGFANPRVSGLPVGMTCNMAGTSTSTAGGTLLCTYPKLEAGKSISFKVNMASYERGLHTNKATVTSSDSAYETITDNNTTAETTRVRVKSDVSVVKTPSKTQVDLREEFTWDIVVRSLTGNGLEIAETVKLTDTLPSGMVLTAAPVVLNPLSGQSCSGSAGGRDIACDLGDMEVGTQATIQIKTKIIDKNAASAINTASVSTASYDQNMGNNSSTGQVTMVKGSTVSGTIYRDFNENSAKEAHDSGVSGVTVTLTGTATHDGETITRTVQTNADGSYEFLDLPPGTYEVSYGNVPNADRYLPGKSLPGTKPNGATKDPASSGVDRIVTIETVGESAHVKNDFTLYPKPSMGLSKVVATPALQTDGTYLLAYTIKVKNLSDEPLKDIQLDDVLNGSGQNFGTLASGATLGDGEYLIESLSASGISTINNGFNGSTNSVLLGGGTLAADATGTVSLTIRVKLPVPMPSASITYTNQVDGKGTGEYSSKPVTDKSDNSSDGENHPDRNSITPATVTPQKSVKIEKTATPERTDGKPAQVGDRINYKFKVTNTGKIALINVAVTDPLVDLQGLSTGTIARLEPGAVDETTFTAYYILTQADIDNGKVDNTATVKGQWGPNGNPENLVTNTSTASVPSLDKPGLTLKKELESASSVQNPTVVGDLIRYKFTVENTGNTVLKNVTITDALAGVTADPAGAFTIGTMQPGEKATVYANYAVKLADINNGKVHNSAKASGSSGPSNKPVTTPNSDVDVPVYQNPDYTIVKKFTGTPPTNPKAGDPLTWTVTIHNSGNVTLKSVKISDNFPGATITPASVASLDPGRDAVFTVTTNIRQSDINAGKLVNIATGNTKDPQDKDLPPKEGQDEVPLPGVPSIELVKTIDRSGLTVPELAGQTVRYKFVIRNTGNQPITAIKLTDVLTDLSFDTGTEALLLGTTLQPQNSGVAGAISEITVWGSYVLKAEDIHNAKLSNIAHVEGKPTADPGVPTKEKVEDSDQADTTFTRDPKIRLIKTVASTEFSTPVKPGDKVHFAFAVKNIGNVTIEKINITELVANVAVENIGNWAGPLAAGESNTTAFTATYALTQADIDAGTFANTAKVVGSSVGGTPNDVEDTSGTTIDNDDPTTVPVTRTPGLTLVKSETHAFSDPAKPGDVINYSFLITNTGNVTLTNVVLTDALPGLVLAKDKIATLAPGASETLTGIYALKQSDIDAGNVHNSATASGKDPTDGDVVTPPSEVDVPVVGKPAFTITKEISGVVPQNPLPGDELTWKVTVTNTGNVTLKDVVVTDPFPNAVVTPALLAELAPAGKAEFTVTAPIKQSDINAGKAENTATANAKDPSGSDLPPEDGSTSVPLTGVPSIQLKKTGDVTGVQNPPKVGDKIVYTLVVKNSGNLPLTHMVLTDELDGFELDGGEAARLYNAVLQPLNTDGSGTGDTITLHGSYKLKAEDINAGKLTNIAHVVGVPDVDPSVTPIREVEDTSGTDFDNDDPTETPLDRQPEIELIKSVSSKEFSTPVKAGDKIHYAFEVINTGNVTIEKIDITDQIQGVVLTKSGWTGPLLAGESNKTAFTATYVLTQADINNGSFVNRADVIGSSVGGTPDDVTDDSDTTVEFDRLPGLTLEKSATPDSFAAAKPGDEISYSFLISNTGNVTLTNVVLTDPLPGLVLPVKTIASLEPGTSQTLTGTYALKQTDIDAGKVHNSATAAGKDPTDGPVETPPSEVDVPIQGNPDFTIVKQLTSAIPANPHAGDQLQWSVTVENTGNVTLKNVVVTDPFPNAVITPASYASLAPKDVAVFTVTAPIKQSDINNGQAVNTATANAKDPSDKPVPPKSDDEITPLELKPEIKLTKTGDYSTISSPAKIGDLVEYSMLIENIGNVPLANLELIDHLADFKLKDGEQARLDAAVLQPVDQAGAGTNAITVKGTYVLKAGDINNGTLQNSATVNAVPQVEVPVGGVTDEDDTETPLERHPEIRLIKTVSSTEFSTPVKAGDKIHYAFEIRNTGNVTLEKIRIEELVKENVKVQSTGWTGPLAAGESNTTAFTATYVLTQDDINKGSFANSAKVFGSSVGGTPDDVDDVSGTDVPNDDPTVTEFERQPGLSIVKSASPALSQPAKPGDVITYSFLITNTGNVTLTNVVLNDPLPDLVLEKTTIDTLLPGAENAQTLTGTYVLKQSDIQAGQVVNQAKVEGEFEDPTNPGNPTKVPAESEEITVPIDQKPSLALVKSAESKLNTPASKDEEIIYTFTVTNTGNLQLYDVKIDDPLPNIQPSSFDVGELQPGESKTFTATYAITEGDIDAEKVDNQAKASGKYKDPGDRHQPVEDLSGPTNETDEPVTVPVTPPAPQMTIVKTGKWDDANGNGYPEVGEKLEYTFTVTNTGNALLNNVTPVDNGPKFNGHDATAKLSPFTPDPVTLNPGQSQVFKASYVLTQDDINNSAGINDAIVNKATAKGTTRTNKPYETAEVEAKVNLPAAEPSAVRITKQAVLRQIKRGERAPYVIKVENNSSSNAGPVNVIDTMPSGFRFVEDSATLDGVKITPTVVGRRITFENLKLGPNSSIEIRLNLLALSTAGPGKHVNTASVTDMAGQKIAKDAYATVEIVAEPVFDCGDIVGTVFDDKNRNGYQDQGEPGLPGVRVASVNGWLVTTDQYGRFHVACADLPDQRIGSNFIMKLDTRTLPTGYRVTTENPRVVRLTAGKMSKLNFGASISRVVRLDLQGQAFADNSTELKQQWTANLNQLIDVLKQEPSVLRLSYTATTGEGDLAKKRMKAVRDSIAKLWKKNGSDYHLEIETRVGVSK